MRLGGAVSSPALKSEGSHVDLRSWPSAPVAHQGEEKGGQEWAGAGPGERQGGPQVRVGVRLQMLRSSGSLSAGT